MKMFGAKNSLNAYVDVQNTVTGADFERRWFESVIMVLNQIQAGMHDPVKTHIKLLEVRDGLQWVQSNLNERLNSQHRTMLKNIYSTNIQIINSAIEAKNISYLDIVITSIKTILEPYNKTMEMAKAA
jgi:hypothetical protein